MLKDRRILVERKAREVLQGRQLIRDYASFLQSHFFPGDWFVTITFRDCNSNFELNSKHPGKPRRYRAKKRYRDVKPSKKGLAIYKSDPRIDTWQPQSRNRVEPGPPVRDAALREIEHFLLEIGWEAAGRHRQEIFDWLADGLLKFARKVLARKLHAKCLCCALLESDRFADRFRELHSVASNSVHWVIAEEYGHLGGRWHVHILMRGVAHLRRKKWWKRAFIRFGRTRIEPIRE